jgi:integrase
LPTNPRNLAVPIKLNQCRFFEREEFERVVVLLPQYLKDFARFAYCSAWRKNEIASLEWRDIEGETLRLRPEISKNTEGRLLIITGEIAEIIERRRTERKDLIPYIFHREGHKIQYNIDRPWKKACIKAGVPNKLFHDLRRTAVRNMVRAGVPERIAMSISGHKTRMIFDRYNIVNEEDIRQGLLRTQEYLQRDKEKIIPLFSAKIGQNTDT